MHQRSLLQWVVVFMQQRCYNIFKGTLGYNRTEKVRKGSDGAVNIWSLKEKNSGIKFVSPNIPAIKYGRDMGIEAVNTFAEYIKNYQQDCIISECVLDLDESMSYIVSSPDWLMWCSCCGKAYMKMPIFNNSIIYIKPYE